MARIEWEESFSVGNSEIDHQHQSWITIYNELDDTLLRGDMREIGKVTADTLRKMLDYARYHFRLEEEYMDKIGYPHLIEHRRLHKDFDNQIYQYFRAVLAGELVLNTAISKIIRNWLVDHILGEDRKYRLFVEKDYNLP